jgi:hypothetical protein
MSSFDKYFSSIQDKASRYYRRLADLDDLIYDRYFNKFRGKTVFEAEVLSDPGAIPAEGSSDNTDLFVPLRVRIKDIHDNRLPDPYDAVEGITDPAKKLEEFRKLILSHPVAYPDTKDLLESAISNGITQGSIVEVYFAEEGPDFNGRMRGLRYRQVIIASSTRTIPTELSISSGFEAGQTSALGDLRQFESLEQLLTINNPEAGITEGAENVDQIADFIDNPEGTTSGTGYPQTTARVESELARWSGLTETSEVALPFLTEYWNNIINTGEPWFKDKWTPTGSKWSAAFISYILRDSDFKSSASHLNYFKKNGAESNKWDLFSLTKPGKIKAQVGDILGYDSHSDIVYKIENNEAHLAGGNLGNTAKVAAKIPLENGAYPSGGKYVLVLKRM